MSRTPAEFVGFPAVLATLLGAFHTGPYGPYRAVSRFDPRYDDGDTSLVMVDAGFDVYPIDSVRFLGINAPETSTPEGRDVRALLGQTLLVAGSPLVLVTSWDGVGFGRDKYGRLLAVLFAEGLNGKAICVNKLLVDTGQATPYIAYTVMESVALAWEAP